MSNRLTLSMGVAFSLTACSTPDQLEVHIPCATQNISFKNVMDDIFKSNTYLVWMGEYVAFSDTAYVQSECKHENLLFCSTGGIPYFIPKKGEDEQQINIDGKSYSISKHWPHRYNRDNNVPYFSTVYDDEKKTLYRYYFDTKGILEYIIISDEDLVGGKQGISTIWVRENMHIKCNRN